MFSAIEIEFYAEQEGLRRLAARPSGVPTERPARKAARTPRRHWWSRGARQPAAAIRPA